MTMLNQSQKEYPVTSFLLNPSIEYFQSNTNQPHSLENGFLFNSNILNQDFNQLFSYTSFSSKNFKQTQNCRKLGLNRVVFRHLKWAARLKKNHKYSFIRKNAHIKLKLNTLFFYKQFRRRVLTNLPKHTKSKNMNLHKYPQYNSLVYHPYFINFETKLRQNKWVWLGTPVSQSGSLLTYNQIVNLDSYQAKQIELNINSRSRRKLYRLYTKMTSPNNIKNTYALFDLLARSKQSEEETDETSNEAPSPDSLEGYSESANNILYKVVLRPLRKSYKKISRILNFRSEARLLFKNFYTLYGRSQEQRFKFHLQRYPMATLLTLVMRKAGKRVITKLDVNQLKKSTKAHNSKRATRIIQNTADSDRIAPQSNTLKKNIGVLKYLTTYSENTITVCKSFFYTNTLRTILNLNKQPIRRFNKCKTIFKTFRNTARKSHERVFNTLNMIRFMRVKFQVIKQFYNHIGVLKTKITKNIIEKFLTFDEKIDTLKRSLSPHITSVNHNKNRYKTFKLMLQNATIKKIKRLKVQVSGLNKKIKLISNSKITLPVQTDFQDRYSKYTKSYTNRTHKLRTTKKINKKLRLVKFIAKKYSKLQHNMLTLYPHLTHRSTLTNFFKQSVKKQIKQPLNTNVLYFFLKKYFFLTMFIQSKKSHLLMNRQNVLKPKKLRSALSNYWWKSKNLRYYTTNRSQTFYQDFPKSTPSLLLNRRKIITYFIKKIKSEKRFNYLKNSTRVFVWFTNSLSQYPVLTYKTVKTIFKTTNTKEKTVSTIFKNVSKAYNLIWTNLPDLARAFKTHADTKFLKTHFIESRGFFKTSTGLTFLLNASSFYYTLVFKTQHQPTLQLIKRRRQSMYSFSNALELKRMCIKQYLRKPKYNTNFKKLTKLYQTFGFGMYVHANAPQVKWDSTPNFITYSLLLDDSQYAPKSKRVRFKPGYSRIWRRARQSFQTTFFLKFRYQHRLTTYIQTRDWVNIRPSEPVQPGFNQENLLFLLLIRCKFATDLNWSSELLKNNYVFVNGFAISNPHTVIVKGDFLQLLIHIKYYIIMKWQKKAVSKTTKRLLRFVGRKFKPKNYRLESDRNYRLPDWLLKLTRYTGHVPSYIELDFFTLSGFMIFNPFLSFHFSPFMGDINHPRVLRLYNWKYIN